MVFKMKKKISLIALISVMSSVLQPAWSMEGMDTEETNSNSKKRKQPEKATDPQLKQCKNGGTLKKEKKGDDLHITSSTPTHEETDTEEEEEEENGCEAVTDKNLPAGVMLRQAHEEEVFRFFNDFPVELTSKIVHDYLSPEDAWAFGVAGKSHFDIVYAFHPVYEDLVLFLSDRGYFKGNDSLTMDQKIRKFYLARRGNPKPEMHDSKARDKAKILMSKFFRHKRSALKHQPLPFLAPAPAPTPGTILTPLRGKYIRIGNNHVHESDNLAMRINKLSLRARDELENLDNPDVQIYFYKHFIKPKERNSGQTVARKRTNAQMHVVSFVSGLTFEQNPGLFYKVARAIFRKTIKKLSDRIYAELDKFLKMPEEDQNKVLTPSQQIKLIYMLKLRDEPLEKIDWSKFEASYVRNLMPDENKDSPHQRLNNLLLAARFASFLYWNAGKDEGWLKCLSKIDELGKEIPSWIPIDIYLYQYYLNRNSKNLPFHLLIPSMSYSIHQSSTRSMLLSFYKKRLIEAYSEDEKILQRFPSMFPARMVEKDTEEAKNSKLFVFNYSKYREGDPSCTNDLGYCCEMGLGTLIRLPLAFTLYRRAAEAGNLFGKCNLAHCYQEGIGTDPNPGEAQRLFGEVDPETLEKWKKARGL